MVDRTTERGFTTVELMVVVLIIGILVSMAVPVLNSSIESARTRVCQHNLRTLDGAVEQWKSANENDVPASVWGVGVDEPIEDAGSLVEDLAPFVADFETATTCPKGGSYHVTIQASGDVRFICSDHGDSY